jgi:hypothetical protein
MSEMTTITVRVTQEQKDELVRKYGSPTKAVRSLLGPKPVLRHHQKAYVICGSFAEFRRWQEEQVRLREQGREHLRPANAVFVGSWETLRGLSLRPEQVVRYGSWRRVMDTRMTNALSLALMAGDTE